jgi:hypothetical protein
MTMRGWTTLEVEMAMVDLIRTGEALVSYDELTVITSKRRHITRQWLRSVNAPKDEPFRAKCLNNFPSLPSGDETKEVNQP